jgi:hypothetical protein
MRIDQSNNPVGGSTTTTPSVTDTTKRTGTSAEPSSSSRSLGAEDDAVQSLRGGAIVDALEVHDEATLLRP